MVWQAAERDAPQPEQRTCAIDAPGQEQWKFGLQHVSLDGSVTIWIMCG
jgi:hypothetical protein